MALSPSLSQTSVVLRILRAPTSPSLINAVDNLATFGYSLSSPRYFDVTDGFLSPGDIVDSWIVDEFEVTFQVRTPNYGATLVFKPHEFLNQGSNDHYAHFCEVKKRAVGGSVFEEEDFRVILLPFMMLLRLRYPRDDVKDAYTALSLKDIEYKGHWDLACSWVNNKPVLKDVQYTPKATSYVVPVQKGFTPSWWPIFDHSKVLFTKSEADIRSLTSYAPPQKVRAGGETCVYRPIASSPEAGAEEWDAVRQAISPNAGSPSFRVRVSPLLGVVVDGNSEVEGILEECRPDWVEEYLRRGAWEDVMNPDQLYFWASKLQRALAFVNTQAQYRLSDIIVDGNGAVWLGRSGGHAAHVEKGDALGWFGPDFPQSMRIQDFVSHILGGEEQEALSSQLGASESDSPRDSSLVGQSSDGSDVDSGMSLFEELMRHFGKYGR